MNLEKKTEEWVKAGLLPAAARNKILSYETKDNKNVFSFAFLLIGALCIGVGLISLIAANWWTIPDAVKLIVDFALLGGCGYLAFRLKNKGRLLGYEAVLFLFSILVMASIGLVAQIFHLHSSWANGALFWSALTLPLAILSRHILIFFFWIPICSGAVFWKLINYHWYQELIKKIGMNIKPLFALPFMPIFIAFLIPLVHFIFRGKGRNFTVPYLFWRISGAYVSVLTLDMMFSFFLYKTPYFMYQDGTDTSFKVLFYLVVAAIASVSFLLVHKDSVLPAQEKRVFRYGAGAFCAAGALAAIFYFRGLPMQLFSVLCSLGFLFLGALISFYQNRRKLFYFFAALIGIRFVVVYYQIFGSMIFTGWGLIISGLLIIALVMFWFRIIKFFSKFFPEKARKGGKAK